jgi:hypothetical protein
MTGCWVQFAHYLSIESTTFSNLELDPMYCARLSLPLAFILSLSIHTIAQSNEGTQGKSSPAAVPVTLSMDWSRGDAHYGPDFIQLRAPCQPPSEKSCECVADFKVISSKEDAKEFANYVTSFERGKVPVNYRVWYNADGLVAGAQFLGLGKWTSDKLHPNDGLLGVKIKFHADGPGQVQSTKINSPGDCFPKYKH